MTKTCVLAGLSDFYSKNRTGYSELNFTLKNTSDLSTKLGSLSWITPGLLFNEAANKSNITQKLTEVIEQSPNEDDWILFYFTGHGAQYWFRDSGRLVNKTYCVTYTPNLKFNFLPDLSEFFSEIDYGSIIQLFKEKKPAGHLITILDCCFAFGLVENFATQQDFHTVIAATSENELAAYDTNSTFFTAFKASWDLPFSRLPKSIIDNMATIDSPNIAKIQIAKNFINTSLNS